MCDVGDLIEGRYLVKKGIGSGGMGIVYQATDLVTNGNVAVKVLSTSVDPSVEARARLRREIDLLSRLNSPHIASFLAAGYLEDGLPYFVMEFLEGRDLKAELRRRGPLPCEEAAAYLVHACRGVAVAHGLGIVHRDLKPHNLFLTGIDGVRTLKVVDFGAAKCLDVSCLGITATDTVIGTPLYMSPEQLLDSRAISTRSDIWALGVILYELLAGFSPFSDDSPGAVIAAVTLDEPVPIQKVRPDVPDDLAEAIAATLVKQPQNRIGTAGELEQLLLRRATPDHDLIVHEGVDPFARTVNERPPRTRVSAYLRDQILAALDAASPQERVTLRSLPTASSQGSRPLPERLSLLPALQSLTPELPRMLGEASKKSVPTLSAPSRVRSIPRTALAFIALVAAAPATMLVHRQYSRPGTSSDSVQSSPQSASEQSTLSELLSNAGAPRDDVAPRGEQAMANVEPAPTEPTRSAKRSSIDEPDVLSSKVRTRSRGASIATPAAPDTTDPVQPKTATIVPRHL